MARYINSVVLAISNITLTEKVSLLFKKLRMSANMKNLYSL